MGVLCLFFDDFGNDSSSGVLTFSSVASAETWHVHLGAESKDQALQADAFLPNEIWIYAGNSIMFKFPDKNEIHTVTLLQAGQDCPFLAQSAPGTTRLRIKFTKPGTYPYYCDLHDVDGTVGKVIVLP